jgi:hypothetical protein
MQRAYVAPELKTVGEADDVVLGNGGAGPDAWGEDAWDDMEFESDLNNEGGL